MTVPREMRAVVARAFGPPETFSLESWPLPEPQPGEVRIRTVCAGVSFVDALIASGGYQVKPPLPYVPGSEFSGVIEAVGDGVNDMRPGDRVCALGWGGVFAEQAVVPRRSARRIPDGMSFADAAVIRVAYMTAMYGLRDRGALLPDERLLVLGAGGAVGRAAIEIGKACGARVIAAASSSEKRDAAIHAGADLAIDSEPAGLRQALNDSGASGAVDVVFDPVGGPVSDPAFRSLAWRGRHLVVGFASGSIPTLRASLALLKGASLVGVDLRRFTELEPDRASETLDDIFILHSKKQIRPAIAHCYRLEDFAEAMTMAGSGRSSGRILLQMADL